MKRVERRNKPIRRALGHLIMRNGEVQESKGWAAAGKIICVYMLLWYTEKALASDFGLAVLLGFLIVPDVAKKAITMKYSNAINGKGK